MNNIRFGSFYVLPLKNHTPDQTLAKLQKQNTGYALSLKQVDFFGRNMQVIHVESPIRGDDFRMRNFNNSGYQTFALDRTQDENEEAALEPNVDVFIHRNFGK